MLSKSSVSKVPEELRRHEAAQRPPVQRQGVAMNRKKDNLLDSLAGGGA